MNPAVAVIIVLTGVLMFCLPRNKAIVPFLLTSILIPSDQILVIVGLHFPLLRILIFFGMIRIFIIRGRGKWSVFSGGMNRVDKSVILLSIVSAVAGLLLFRTSQAFTFQLGELYTALGTYFLLRCLIRDNEDVVRVIRVLAFVVIVVGGVMVFEHLTNGWNPYALLGGAHARNYATDMMRDGKIRATGSFAQPILAGTFGAIMLPLFIGLWLKGRDHRGSAIVGMVGATAITMASNSSTPLIGYAAALLGLCLWPFRGILRIIRWGIVATLALLQMVMKAPVWSLISRFDISGSGYHRYQLIDTCIRHFWDWWLIGTNSNAYWGWDMWDTANEYVAHAYSGGLLGLICFVAIIVYGFKYLGNARQATTDKRQALFFWALGSGLLAFVVCFFGISLWDQSIVGWYGLLAFITAVAVPQKMEAPIREFETTFDRGIAAVVASPANVPRWARLSVDRQRVDRPSLRHANDH